MTGPGSPEIHALRPDRKNQPQSIEALHARLVSSDPRNPVSPSLPLKVRNLPSRSNATAAQSTTDSIAPTIKPVVPLKAPEQKLHEPFRAALRGAERAVRLSMDALIILVFSPVIGVWWLLERRRQRKSSR